MVVEECHWMTNTRLLLKANTSIERYVKESNRVLDSYHDELEYVAGKLPSVFSKGTRYDSVYR